MIDDEIVCAHGEKMKFKCAQCEEMHRIWTVRDLTRKAKKIGMMVVPQKLSDGMFAAYRKGEFEDDSWDEIWDAILKVAEIEQDYPDAVETSSGGRVWP